ncbi:MAG: hypothetical protein V5A66_05755, partial [Candidatus Thermoplasmatota archaeon]
MQNRHKKRVGITVLVITILLVLGTVIPGMILFGGTESIEGDETLVLAYASNRQELKGMDEYGRIIDDYGRNVLIETTE